MMIIKCLIQRLTLKVLFTGMCLGLMTSFAHAQNIELDRIAAVVNDDVVMLSEVKRAASRNKTATKGQVSDNVLIKDALESIILQKIQLQRAKDIGIVIDDAALNRAMLSIAEQNKLNLPQFKVALAREGIDYRGFQDNLKDKLYLENLRRRHQNSSETISEVEVDDLIQSQSLRLAKDVQYQLIDVMIPAPNGTSVQQFNRLLVQAQNLRRQLLLNPNELSNPIISKMGGTKTDLGWKSAQTLSPAYVRTLSLMGAGELSNIVRDQRGFHILKLVAQRGGDRKITQQAKVRHILIPSTDSVAKLKITKLRNQILAGEDFATLAKQNSADKGSAQDGGNLGLLDPSVFVPPFANAVRSLPLNTLSQPIQTKFGWHILEVLERKTSDQTREALKLQAQSLISKDKDKNEYNNWVQGIRDEAFIEYRVKL